MNALKTKIRNRSEEDHLHVRMRIESQGRQSRGFGGRNPPDFGQGVVRRSQGGREILLYLIMYRKYVYV